MKELSKKTFLTIFVILMAITVMSMAILNLENYQREFEGIRRNLDILEIRGREFGGEKPTGEFPGDRKKAFWENEEKTGEAAATSGDAVDVTPPEFADGELPEFADGELPEELPQMDLENMMIMDYEVYTVETSGGEITKIFNHAYGESDFAVEKVAKEIIENHEPGTIYTGNLYISDYSFNYKENGTLVVINNAQTRTSLRKLLLESLLLFCAVTALVFLIAKQITVWITKPAKEAFNKQREFIADASHELKTPLAVIMASSDELIAENGSSKYLENIKYETDRMSRLITGMLELSKMEDGLPKTLFKEENLSKIVEKTCSVFEGVAFEQGVLIETDVEENVSMQCSRDDMEKLVSILVDNAIKHSYKDTSIRVGLHKSKKHIRITVTNTGDPIREGEEAMLFERFYRADKSRSRSENRYGLGLAIAKSIVTNHGGTITAGSEGNQTTFQVALKIS